MNKAVLIVLVIATAVAVVGGVVWWELGRRGVASTTSTTTANTAPITTTAVSTAPYTTTATSTVTATAPLNTLTTTPWVQEAMESLELYPDSRAYPNGTLVLHIANRGSAPAVIYKVEVVGEGEAQILSATGRGVTLSGGEVRVDPGGEGYAWPQLDKTLIQYRVHAVKVYTRAGNVYMFTIQCIP